ncbi:MAG: prepilin-type N-terminal cleavage/methylation domain-containing protein [Proteobacteria bacterium]|nr:prepilin-type N-terminal cleavage/methylation domain-containing protein [Pseudomonadota bacterium]
MPISTVGSDRSFNRVKHCGFTLVELLVVLSIMAFATLAVAPSLQRMVAPRPPRPIVEQLLEAIGRSRDEAIQKRQTFRGLFDPGNMQWQDAEGNVLFQLPEDTSIAPENGASTQPMFCVFRPDGSGCDLSLKFVQDDREWRVKVDPVTGRIRLMRFTAQ